MVQLIVGSRCQTEVERAEQDSGIRPTADEDNVLFVAQSWLTLCDPMDCSPPGSPGKNMGVGCPALLQGIFPTQGPNPGLLCYRPILYCLSLQGSPRILEWVVYPSSQGTSPPRNQIGVSRMAGGFFTS